MSQTDRCTIVIIGFIREISNEPISQNIIDLCVRFYRNIHQIFAHNELQFYMVNIHQNGIANILMPNDKSNKVIKENKYQLSSSWCYIPNLISNHDGFIGGISKGETFPNNSPENPCVILFKANDNNNFMIEYNLIVSNETILTHNNRLKNYPIYCGKHGCIFEDNGYLYQFNSNNFNQKNGFNFTKIESEWKKKDLNDDNIWLSLCYQKQTETIFTISNTIESLSPISDLNVPFLKMNANGILTTQKKKSKKSKIAYCNVFDLNNKIWENVNNYEYETDFDDTFRRFGICENEYNLNIYIQSNCGHTAKYDFTKQLWYTIFEDVYNEEMHFGGTPLLWFDESPYILFCACDPYFGCFDERVKKWCKINDINHSISSLFL
eukprot:520266_1